MLIEEFSTQFDVLFNNITSNQAPGVDEFEKGVFLTKAQEQLVVEYFNNRTDGVGGGYDGSQKRQYDFSSLVETVVLAGDNQTVPSIAKLDKRSALFYFPKNYFLSVNEQVLYENNQYTVIPLTYAEYQRLMLKPYQLPTKRAVWRLFNGQYNNNQNPPELVPVIEVIGYFTENATVPTATPAHRTEPATGEMWFKLRYVKALTPIILEPLAGGLTIEGYSGADANGNPVKTGAVNGLECKLPKECHHEILERAVTLAKIAWQGGTLTQAQQAQRNRNNDD